MIDSGWAVFEYISMKVQLRNELTPGSHYQYWDLFIPCICGLYFEQEKWLSNMRLALGC
ncbi:hypothetical protein C8R41DRAFT_834117, partial [Lentinula lateritia]